MKLEKAISDAIKYPSTGWSKVLILGVIMLIPIVNFIAIGYLFRIMRTTFLGIDELPDFDDIGELFIDGLKILVIGIIAAIPIIVVYSIIYFVAFINFFTAFYTTSYESIFILWILAIIIGFSFILLIYPYILMYLVRSIGLLASR